MDLNDGKHLTLSSPLSSPETAALHYTYALTQFEEIFNSTLSPQTSPFVAPFPSAVEPFSYRTSYATEFDLTLASNNGGSQDQQRRFSLSQRRILDSWIESHASDPYPSPEAKKKLAALVGISVRQVSDYVSNYRRRRMKKVDRPAFFNQNNQIKAGSLSVKDGQDGEEVLPMRCRAGSPGTDFASIEVFPSTPKGHEPDCGHHSDAWDDIEYISHHSCTKLGEFSGSMLDWYLDTFIDSLDPLSSADAFFEGPFPTGDLDIDPYLRSSLTMPPTPMPENISRRNSSDLPFDTMDLDNIQSDWRSDAGSAHSAASYRSYTSFGARSGRKAYGEMTGIGENYAGSSSNGQVCQYCFSTFATKFTRDRHISSIHEPTSTWTCQNMFPCPHLDCPSVVHAYAECPHRWVECHIRPLKERTYYRKDGMAQHLKVFHMLPLGISESLLDRLRNDTQPGKVDC